MRAAQTPAVAHSLWITRAGHFFFLHQCLMRLGVARLSLFFPTNTHCEVYAALVRFAAHGGNRTQDSAFLSSSNLAFSLALPEEPSAEAFGG
jgi:hypothetical protein